MILSEIYARVRETVQDEALTGEEKLLSLVNEAVQRGCKACQPELVTTAVLEVPAETPGITGMPENYGHTLYRMVNRTTGDLINIRTGSKYLSEAFGGLTDDVRKYTTDAAIHNNSLWFRPVCAYAQSFELWYYRKPVVLDGTDLSAVPDGIPSFLHQRLIVGYILKESFTLIEDGIEGQKVNTINWNQEYVAGLQELDMYCRKSPRQTPIIRRTARFF